MVKKARPYCFFGILLLSAAFGCGQRLGEVSGTVFVEEKPCPFVTVNFRSTQTETKYSSRTRADYSYYLLMPSGERKIPVGDYKVWLSIPEGMEDLPETVAVQEALPEKLFDESTSGLSCTVTTSGTVFDIDANSN